MTPRERRTSENNIPAKIARHLDFVVGELLKFAIYYFVDRVMPSEKPIGFLQHLSGRNDLAYTMLAQPHFVIRLSS